MSQKLLLIATVLCTALVSELAVAQDQTSAPATTTPASPPTTDQTMHQMPAGSGTDMAQFCAHVNPNGRFYPSEAFERGIQGVATLECALDAGNRPEICWLLSETPQGQNFGPAGLRLACLVRTRHPMQDVSRAFHVDGDARLHLRMPMNFRLAG